MRIHEGLFRMVFRLAHVPLLLGIGAALLIGCRTTVPPDGANENENANTPGNENDNATGNENDNGGPVAATYVGSDRCATCHGEIHESFLLTGHPYKLNEVANGGPPQFPVTELVGPPEGLEWTDITFVIGGFRWKYRVMDQDGYIVLGPTAQYNFPTESWGSYRNDAEHTTLEGVPGPWDSNIGRSEYDCGLCHTTAFDEEAPSHGGLAGVVGDWAFEGIHCEECHGPGSNHVASQSPEDINGRPDTNTVCGKCHTREADGIAAKGGFIEHHEQWDEFSRTAHAAIMTQDGCMTCHNPHEPLFDATRLAAFQEAVTDPMAVDNLDPMPGIIQGCTTTCHASVTVNHVGGNECISCHMAFTGKSAVALNPNMGDVRSHAWKINTDAEAMMFTDEEGDPVARDSADLKFAALDEDGRPFITLDFACLRCHTDRDVAWAAENTEGIHE